MSLLGGPLHERHEPENAVPILRYTRLGRLIIAPERENVEQDCFRLFGDSQSGILRSLCSSCRLVTGVFKFSSSFSKAVGDQRSVSYWLESMDQYFFRLTWPPIRANAVSGTQHANPRLVCLNTDRKGWADQVKRRGHFLDEGSVHRDWLKRNSGGDVRSYEPPRAAEKRISCRCVCQWRHPASADAHCRD